MNLFMSIYLPDSFVGQVLTWLVLWSRNSEVESLIPQHCEYLLEFIINMAFFSHCSDLTQV